MRHGESASGVVCHIMLGVAVCLAFNGQGYALTIVKYSGGSGTAEAPYEIADANDLLKLAGAAEDWGAHFTLISDIDMAGVAMSPIGSSDSGFAGVFEGNGRVIRNLSIDLPELNCVGLFGRLWEFAAVRNLRLEGVDIIGGSHVGGIAGDRWQGEISGCFVAGKIGGIDYVGGLIGSNMGDLSDCATNCSVSGEIYVGGLVGKHGWAEIVRCGATGQVRGDRMVGGLAGSNDEEEPENARISECWFDGTVSGNEQVGGLVGWNHGYVLNNYSRGEVNAGGAQDVGGLVGYGHYGGMVTDCHSASAVVGGSRAGGLVGYGCRTRIIGCYSTGGVDGGSETGGLVGRHEEGEIVDCWSTGLVAGGASVGGLVGYSWGGDYPPTEIRECYFVGRVQGGDETGGLVGTNGGSHIIRCYAASVTGAENMVGGLVGVNHGQICDSYALGSVTGGGDAGGLIGVNQTYSQRCYSACDVLVAPHASRVGGFIGLNTAWGSDSFWDIEMQSWAVLEGIGKDDYYEPGYVVKGLLSGVMHDENTFLSAGWDFVGETDNGTEDVWRMAEGWYPVLAWQSLESVPDVEGLNYVEAETILREAGWSAVIRWVFDEEAEADAVLSQNPPAGGGASQGAAVVLRVCSNTMYPGSGTFEEPFLISSAGQLIEMGRHPADWRKHFRMTADIDLSGHVFDTAPIAPARGPSGSYGFVGMPFTGMFDGNGFIIRGLRIEGGSDEHIGLFGCVMSGGRVVGLSIEDGFVSGGNYVGGIAGEIRRGHLARCRFSGEVHGGTGVGGLVGGEWEYASILSCCADVNVVGDSGVGGLAGYCSGTLQNSFAAGRVSGREAVGGIAGNHYGIALNCYSICDIAGAEDVGGLVGIVDSGTVMNCMWDTEVQSHGIVDAIGSDSSSGGANVQGLPTAAMQSRETFLSAGWDFAGERARGTCEIWEMVAAGGGYPVLASAPAAMLSGSGTAGDPYRIGTVEELGLFYWYPDDAYFRLAADVESSGISWSGPVKPYFCGEFEGNGHRIVNLTISVSAADYIGLFGCVGPGGEVRDLVVDAVQIAGREYVGGITGLNDHALIRACRISGSVTGEATVGGVVGENTGVLARCRSEGVVSGLCYVGGLAGTNANTIRQSSFEGSVTGPAYGGGLVGFNWPDGTIRECYFDGDMAGEWRIGGIAGYNQCGQIRYCYAQGMVSGEDYVGGITGESWNQGIVRDCYSACDVDGTGLRVGGLVGTQLRYSVTMDCVWNGAVQSHGVTKGIGISDQGSYIPPRTTAQMFSRDTYKYWAFVGDGRGIEDIWRMCADGVDYPRLAWERGQFGDVNCPDGVGLEDVAYLAERWLFAGHEMRPAGAADVNGDERVDMADFGVVAGYFGEME